jgi:apolipoprotein N-acyltransferase
MQAFMDRNKLFAALLSGALLTAAFPRMGVGGVAWLALVPLLWALRDLRPACAFRLGLVAGGVHYLTLIYWVAYTLRTYGHLPWVLCASALVLLCTYLALFTGLFAAALAGFSSRPLALLLAAPILWTGLEYLRSFLLSGFPWGLLGYTQVNWLPLIQLADLVGVYGVSFLVVLVNAAATLALSTVFSADRGRRVTPVAGLGALLAAAVAVAVAWGYGHWRIQGLEARIRQAPTVKVAVVQGNIPQAEKWAPAFQTATIEKYARLSIGLRNQRPDLVVWPETAAPFYFGRDAELSLRVADAVRRAATSFLIGSPSYAVKDAGPVFYNSAFLLGPEAAVHGKYDKAHLVPFGEYVPLRRWLPFLGKLVAQVGDFEAGPKGLTLQWGPYRLGVQICYEIIFPGLARAMTLNGADLIVNLTNDAWYGRSSAPFQHFMITVFRAVENRRTLVRAANTGISGFVDPVGRVHSATDLFEDAAVARSLPILTERSVYTRRGDLFAGTCLAGAGLVVIAAVIRRRRGAAPGRQNR